jgi:regulator of sigma E protease
VIAVNDDGIRSGKQLGEKLDASKDTVKLKVVRFTPVIDGVSSPELIDAEVALGNGVGLERIGAESGDAYVWQVRPGTPAAAYGIKAGDRFVSVNSIAVHSVGGVEDRMALAKKKNITFEWRSTGEVHAGNVGPLVPEGNDKYCMTSPDFGVRFGAPGLPMAPIAGELVTIHFGPGDAMLASLKRLPEGVVLIASILGKLTTGDVPLESMGGPLQIAQVATQSAEQGIASFVSSMWMVSVNLALVNLLPIPILDGFGILTALWEAIRRRPIPTRAREIAQYAGLVMLGMLMVLAFRNDIARLLFC